MRQAIIIIHGIGEQKPMSTLRGFVDTLVKYEAWEKIKAGKLEKYERNYWSKPDEMSESFELRKLVLAGKRERPTTDFFEYYWAFNMQDTNIGHLVPWFKTLLFKWPWLVPKRLLWVWGLSWLLMIGIVSSLLSAFSILEVNLFSLLFKSNSNNQIYSLISTVILIILQRTLIGYVGDAARYLTPDPANIKERHNIRKSGIELLRKLHEVDQNGKRKYDRIVMVGHSLGSVIAYDIITYLWVIYNKMYGEEQIIDKVAFDKLKEAADQLEEAIQQNKSPSEIASLRDTFRCRQIELGKALRKAGNPWLITDFVTLGSPLSHGAFLLSNSKEDFEDRKNERELITCPPVSDRDKYYYYDIREERYFLHHAAAFAPTVWTNIYYPGDFIGGPVSNALGIGIKDIQVEYNGDWQKNLSHFSPLTHLSYWLTKAEVEQMDSYKIRDTIKVLFDAVDLNNIRQEEHFEPKTEN